MKIRENEAKQVKLKCFTRRSSDQPFSYEILVLGKRLYAVYKLVNKCWTKAQHKTNTKMAEKGFNSLACFAIANILLFVICSSCFSAAFARPHYFSRPNLSPRNHFPPPHQPILPTRTSVSPPPSPRRNPPQPEYNIPPNRYRWGWSVLKPLANDT